MQIIVSFCLLLFAILATTYRESVRCDQLYIGENGHSCFPCSPGFYKFSDCLNNGEQARCIPCGHHTYQPDCTTAEKCAPCKICQTKQIKLNECNKTHNTFCECQSGTFWVPDANKPDEGFCKDHKICPPGQGLERRGSPYSDTICVDCTLGHTFSNMSSLEECKVCTTCNATKEPNCTTMKDSVCSSDYGQQPVRPFGQSQGSSAWIYAVSFIGALLVLVLVILTVYYYRYKDSLAKKAMSVSDEQTVEQNKAFNAADSPWELDETHSIDIPGRQQDDQDIVTSTRHSPWELDETHSIDIPGMQQDDQDMVTSTRHSSVSEIQRELVANGLSSIERGRRGIDQLDTDGLDLNAQHCIEWSAGHNHISVPSMDAHGVPPRNQQPVDGEPSLGVNRRVHAERSNRLTSSSTVVPPISNRAAIEQVYEKDSAWVEVVNYLIHYVEREDFRRVFRKLAQSNNEQYFAKVDAEIHNKQEEHGKATQESVYQLMTSFRQETPRIAPQDVLRALKSCKFERHFEQLSDKLNQTCRNSSSDVQNDNEHYNQQNEINSR